MTLRHIRIFLALCEHDCNTTRAAEALHMTQPAVSLALRELEEHYGVVLFDRIGRRLRITAAGERFASYASRIAALFDDMERQLRGWDRCGLLRVGASITIGSQFLPSYVKRFCALHPGAEIQAMVAPSELLEQQLMDNLLDLALMEGVPHVSALRSEEYMEDRLVVIVPGDGPFRPGQHLSQAEFRRQKFLLRERGSGSKKCVDAYLEAAGIQESDLQITARLNDQESIKSLVAGGLGVSIISAKAAQNFQKDGKVLSFTLPGPQADRCLYLAYRKDDFLRDHTKRFLDFVRDYYTPQDRREHSGQAAIAF